MSAQDHRRIGGAVNVPLIVSEHHRSVRTPYEKPSPSCPVPGDGFLSSRHEMGGTAGIKSGSAWLASRKRWPPAISPPAKRRNRQGDRRLRERVSNRRSRRASGARGVVDRHRLDADRDGWIRRAGGMTPLSRLPPSLRADRIARSEYPLGASHSNFEHYNAVQRDIGAFNRTARNGQPDAVGFTALVAWTFKDALIKRLDAGIDAEADDPAALSHTETGARPR